MRDIARLERILAAISDAGDRALIERLLPAWVRRAARLARRDQAIRVLAAERYGNLPSGRAIAKEMRRELKRATQSRTGHPPGLRRIVALSDGRVPSLATLRRALAGAGGSNSAGAMSHDECEDYPAP